MIMKDFPKQDCQLNYGWIELSNSNLKLINKKELHKLCTHKYEGHEKGCPNFNKKNGCPPQQRPLNEIYNLAKPFYLVWNIFDLSLHTKRLKLKHPNWSRRQLYCCLYWQGKARKQLKSIVNLFKRQDIVNASLTVNYCPEAMGIDITNTLKKANIILEWPVETVAYQVAFVGNKN